MANGGTRFVLVLVILVNGIVAWQNSRLTELRSVRLVGVSEADKASMGVILATAKNVPYSRVNDRNIEALVLNRPNIATAHLERNFLGRGVLTVSYRKPVARIADAEDLALSDTGVLYREPRSLENLPKLEIDPEARTFGLGLMSVVPLRSLAELAVKAPQTLPTAPLTITFEKTGLLCLNIQDCRIELGSTENLEKKLKALQILLERNRELFQEYERLTLTVPTRPFAVRRNTIAAVPSVSTSPPGQQ